MQRLAKTNIMKQGFTLIEVIAVIIIIGILSAIVWNRHNSTAAQLYTQTDVLKGHIRYAQTMAMNRTDGPLGSVNVWGIKCDGTNYWLFRGTNPDTLGNIFLLPDDGTYADVNRKLTLSRKGITMTAFTVFFDEQGIPYSAYISPANAGNKAITTAQVITTSSGSDSRTVTITPLTGFVP